MGWPYGAAKPNCPPRVGQIWPLSLGQQGPTGAVSRDAPGFLPHFHSKLPGAETWLVQMPVPL